MSCNTNIHDEILTSNWITKLDEKKNLEHYFKNHRMSGIRKSPSRISTAEKTDGWLIIRNQSHAHWSVLVFWYFSKSYTLQEFNSLNSGYTTEFIPIFFLKLLSLKLKKNLKKIVMLFQIIIFFFFFSFRKLCRQNK